MIPGCTESVYRYHRSTTDNDADLVIRKNVGWRTVLRRFCKYDLMKLFPDYDWPENHSGPSLKLLRNDYRVQFLQGKYGGTDAYFIVGPCGKIHVFLN